MWEQFNTKQKKKEDPIMRYFLIIILLFTLLRKSKGAARNAVYKYCTAFSPTQIPSPKKSLSRKRVLHEGWVGSV
jgi:hypothetical protein